MGLNFVISPPSLERRRDRRRGCARCSTGRRACRRARGGRSPAHSPRSATTAPCARSARPAAPSCRAEDLRDDAEHRLHDDGREAERRFVEQQQARLRHQPARDRDHLQLAAGQRPAERCRRTVGWPGKRSNIASASRRIAALEALPFEAPSMMFSRTVRPGKMRRPSGTCAMPSRTIVRARAPRSTCRRTRIDPTRGATRPEIARSVVDLPAPLAPSKRHDAPSSTRARRRAALRSRRSGRRGR